VSETSQPHVNWQPISALPLIGSMIDGLRDEAEQPYTTLQACRPTLHVLDHDTVGRVIEVYTAQVADLWLYEEQLSHWQHLHLTQSQQQEVDRLAAQLPTIRERVTAILALAEELKGGTIEAVLGKSDAKLGLKFLLGQRKP
jgi:hypothetical protein